MANTPGLDIVITTDVAPPAPHVSVTVDMDLGANVLLRLNQHVAGRETKAVDLMVSAERAGAVAHVLTAPQQVLARYSAWLLEAAAAVNGMAIPDVRVVMDSPSTQPPS